MRNWLIYISIILSALHSNGQNLPSQSQSAGTNGNVYAIVVGISAYENPGIPALSFAHKDAEVFATYLSSRSGGSIPAENMRVLLNEKATYAAIYDCMSWVLDVAKQNDLIYFYFSGHGDMENNTIHKLGFLLSYNTPRTNYLNSAVRIEDLNNFANTISARTRARIVLITDACHSGDLAGKSFRASRLVGEQLKATKENEIRITSCAPEQLSVEDEGWGGGRGVFSYHLVNGMQGFADKQKDGVITVSEIRSYLDSVMLTDALLVQKAHVQNPAIVGKDDFNLAFVDRASSAAISQNSLAPPIVFLTPLAKPAQSYFFDALASVRVEETYNFDSLSKIAVEDLPFAFLSLATDTLKQFISDSQLAEIRDNLMQNPDALKRFNNKLVVFLSDRGQAVINDYLSGDEAELERRRYYNSNSNNYDAYPKMLAVALKLAQPGSYLADILKVKYHYFDGITARLKIPLTKDPSPLIAKALQSQLKAEELEKNAAYIQNELGVLYSAKNDLKKAEHHFLRASQIAPTWSIPYSNLSGIYLDRKQHAEALDAANRSLALEPGNQGGFLSLALIYEQKKNFLLAEEYYRTSIELNTRHYFPFERLAYTYLHTTDYALADSFFYEADLRKKGYHFVNPKHMKFPMTFVEALTQNFYCDLDTLNITKSDAMGNFAWAMIHLDKGNVHQAEFRLRISLAADSTSPLAWHYLGKILYDQQRWLEADVMFDHAITYYLDRDQLGVYVKERLSGRDSGSLSECIKQLFLTNSYDGREDRYFLASLSEKWGHFAAAEVQYRYLIKTDSSFIGAYQKLWTLYEDMGRYADAEALIKNFIVVNRIPGERALFSFYKRMINKFPEDKTTYYKAANFLYYLVAVEPQLFIRDHKTIPADSDMEVPVMPFVQKVIELHVKLPGTDEELPLLAVIEAPFSDGIKYFLVADSLYDDDEALAEINQKTGDMYVWQGLSKKAISHYKKSVALQPQNADTRMKLIRTSSANYKLGDALMQLDSLQKRNQLNFDMHMLMAKYTMHASRFDDAASLLHVGSRVYPYDVFATVELQARLNMLKQSRKEAILFYKKLLKLMPGDATILYSIARLHAQMKNEGAAMQALKQSVDKGFNYSWVVNADESWKSLRNNNSWKSVVKSMSPKTY